MQFVKILLRDEMGIDKTELYKVYKKSDTNVKTTEKKFKYKISYPHPKCQKIGLTTNPLNVQLYTKLYTLSTEKPALQGG